MFKVVFFTDIYNELWRSKPYGAYALANILRNNNIDTLVVDHLSHWTLEQLKLIIDNSLDDESLVVGFSFTFFYNFINGKQIIDYSKLREFNSYIKQKFPNIKIVIGGAQSYSIKQKISQEDNMHINYIIHGFADSTILDLVLSLKMNRTPKFSNIINGVKIIDYDTSAANHDFRNIQHHWHVNDIVTEGESLPIEIARGCIFKCKFCTYPWLGKNKNDFSYIKSEENLLREFLENYDRLKTLHYTILDDTFNERTDKIELLCKIRDRSKLDLSFAAYHRLDLIHRKPDQIRLLKNMNMIGFNFGIESLNYEAAKIVGKGLRGEHVIETLHNIKHVYDHKVILQTNFILGLPYDTREKTEEWLNIVLSKDFPSDRLHFSALSISQWTPEKTNFLLTLKNTGILLTKIDLGFGDLKIGHGKNYIKNRWI